MAGFSTRNVNHLLLLASLLASGCAEPYARDDGDRRLQAALEGAIQRELAVQASGAPLQTTPTLDSQVETTLAARRTELDGIGPTLARGGEPLDLGEDLLGQPQE
ncbi:MAG: hypothetical protein VYD99_08575, partial [Planctomycetota bacterium]|nr:hypothetical protein [Planctomycetota bacterium]